MTQATEDDARRKKKIRERGHIIEQSHVQSVCRAKLKRMQQGYVRLQKKNKPPTSTDVPSTKTRA